MMVIAARPLVHIDSGKDVLLRPSFRERLLAYASEFAQLELEVRQLRGEITPQSLVDLAAEEQPAKNASRPPSVGSAHGARCGDVVSLMDCCSNPNKTRVSTCSSTEAADISPTTHMTPSLSSTAIPTCRAQQIREQLAECAGEHESLHEENLALSREVQRLDEIGRVPQAMKPSDDILVNMRQPLKGVNNSPTTFTNVDTQCSSQAATLVTNSDAGSEAKLDSSEKDGPRLPPSSAGLQCQKNEADPEVPESQSQSEASTILAAGLEDSLYASQENKDLKHRIKSKMAMVVDSPLYKVVIAVCLFVALFGGGIAVLLDIPDDPGNQVIDVIMFSIMGIFVLEVILNMIVDWKDYPFSFFFWMDSLGTISMLFEISIFVLSPNGKIKESNSNVDAVILRTARAAKVGARSGRLFKLMKCLSLLFRDKERKKFKQEGFEAKVVSQRLLSKLSTRVSCTVIALVLVMPFLQVGLYPETDLSMRSWSQRLEQQYTKAYGELAGDPQLNSSDSFRPSVLQLVDFYSDVNYMPYRMEGYPEAILIEGRPATILGSGSLSQPEPVRKQNIYKQVLDTCDVERIACKGGNMPALYFNFSEPTKLEVVMDMILICVVIIVMGVASFDLSKTIDVLLVKPLERMLGMLHMYASNILEQVRKAHGVDSEAWDEQESEGTQPSLVAETDLLEDIMRKLARLAQLSTQKSAPQDLEQLDREGQGVIVELMNQKRTRCTTIASLALTKSMALDHSAMARGDIASLPCSEDVIDSWDLDILSFDDPKLLNIVLYIFYDSEVGRATGRQFLKPETFQRFHAAVHAEYQDQPYHCYAHAVDVLQTVTQILRLTQAPKWLSSVDQYALMVSAICHDMGHIGRTNPFLVETRHSLALLYNDRSPLENMHCAKLFEICGQPETDAFRNLDVDGRKQARKVCIATILHTDNCNHTEMVKEISRTYELLSDICENQATQRDGELTPRYSQEVLMKDPQLWLNLFLHMADVSNPMKPFQICKVWAWRVLDEFFAQGDEEKSLGLPVSMLNDRNKVNKPGSQHGFINFMVAPLATASVRLFPVLHPLASEMACNLDQWRHIWAEEANPSPEELAKRDDDVQKIIQTTDELRQRVQGGRRASARMSRVGGPSGGGGKRVTQICVDVDGRR